MKNLSLLTNAVRPDGLTESEATASQTSVLLGGILHQTSEETGKEWEDFRKSLIETITKARRLVRKDNNGVRPDKDDYVQASQQGRVSLYGN